MVRIGLINLNHNMTPQEKQQFEELQRKVTALENVTNLQFVQKLLDYLIQDTPDVVDLDVLATYTDSNGDTAQALDVPDRWVRLRLNGKLYRLGAWLEEFDSTR